MLEMTRARRLIAVEEGKESRKRGNCESQTRRKSRRTKGGGGKKSTKKSCKTARTHKRENSRAAAEIAEPSSESNYALDFNRTS